MIGGTRFYDRREIRDVLAYLRLVANPTDEVSLRRVINVPEARHRRHERSRSSASTQRDQGIALRRRARRTPGRPGVGASRSRRSADSCDLDAASSPRSRSPADEIVDEVLGRTGYRETSRPRRSRDGPVDAIEAEGRLENLEELAAVDGEPRGPRGLPAGDGARRRDRRPRRLAAVGSVS